MSDVVRAMRAGFVALAFSTATLVALFLYVDVGALYGEVSPLAWAGVAAASVATVAAVAASGLLWLDMQS